MQSESRTFTRPKQEMQDSLAPRQEHIDGDTSQVVQVYNVVPAGEGLQGEATMDSKSISASGLKEVIMSLEEELNQCQQQSGGDQIDVQEQSQEDEVREFQEEDEEDQHLDIPESEYPHPESIASARSLRGHKTHQLRRKGPMPRARKLTYSHEQRIQMGYYANKYGVMAMRRKFPGVKESTSRDMRNYVRGLAKQGKISLDEPLEHQLIPPKTRNGMPVHSSLAYANSFCSSSAQPSSSGGGTRSDQSQLLQAKRKRKQSNALETETPQNLSFQEVVQVGFLAVLQGSPLAMKKHNVNETTVKECRNTVIELANSDKISLDIPLEEQVIPPDPNTSSSVTRTKLGRPRKSICENHEKVHIPKQPMVSRLTVKQKEHPRPSAFTVNNDSRPESSESQARGRNQREILPRPQDTDNQGQRYKSNVSLGNDLTFFRWKNRRASLGFKSDQAFAMHLMDVHDAFCAECSGGGRLEHHDGI